MACFLLVGFFAGGTMRRIIDVASNIKLDIGYRYGVIEGGERAWIASASWRPAIIAAGLPARLAIFRFHVRPESLQVKEHIECVS